MRISVLSMHKPILGSSKCLAAAMAGKAQLAKDHANISGHDGNGPSLPQILCETKSEDGPMGVCTDSLTISPHWENGISEEGDLRALLPHHFPSSLCFPSSTSQLWAVARRQKAQAQLLPRAAQVNSPLWTSLQQHRLFRGHGRDKQNAWGASGWPSLPALLYFCFIIQFSLLLGSWSKIKAAGIQLDKTKNTPCSRMCGAGIFVAAWNCLDQRANLQLGFADVQHLCQPNSA